MPPKLDPKAEKRPQNALEFNATNPTEKGVTGRAAYLVSTRPPSGLANVDSPKSQKRHKSQKATHGGHNKVLSDAQNEAI